MDGAPFSTVGYRIRAPLKASGDEGVLLLERLSPTTLIGVVASGAFEPGGRVSFRVEGAALEVGPLQGLVVERQGGDEAQPARVRVALGPLTLLEGRAVLALLEALRASHGLEPDAPRPPTEIVQDSQRVVSLVRQIFELKCESRFFATQGPGSHNPNGLWARPEKLLPGTALPLLWHAEPPSPAAPFDVHVEWMNWDFRFRVEEAVAEDGLVRTSLPQEIVRIRERFQRRAPAPSGASIRFRHPLWPERFVRQPLHDVSLNGASFGTLVVEDGVFPGLELPDVEIAWPSGALVHFQAGVRRVAPTVHDGMVAGVSLVPHRDDDARVWRSLVDQVFYQHTSAANAHPDPMWELYERSGYFNLSGKSTQEFLELRGAFRRVTTKLVRPNEVGTSVVLAHGEATHSAVTVVKPYEHSWFPCQLAKRREPGADSLSERRVLLETILHGFEYPLRDPGFRWLVSWVQTEARWSRWLVYDLTKRFIADPDRASIVPFRAMEARTADARGLDDAPGYDVGPANDDEVRRFLDVVAASRPRSYCEAHDLVPERVDIRGIQRRWQRAGLVRLRHLVVAREGGVPVAAGVMDLVEDGVHLFGLLDVLRTFALAPGGEAAFGAVLEASRAWYREQGKHKFAYFVEHDDYEHAARAGLKDLGTADLVVLNACYMPDQLQHIWEITAPRDQPPLRPAPAETAEVA